ncbi:MAG TPA: hypothetical protein VFH51_15075 [Myxococcota bacterium]|nr:hypothetical protein [Myxococcota bacterium]
MLTPPKSAPRRPWTASTSPLHVWTAVPESARRIVEVVAELVAADPRRALEAPDGDSPWADETQDIPLRRF